MGTKQASGTSVQTTLANAVTFSGTGLHSGRPVRLALRPAAAGHGIVFRRLDLPPGAGDVPAHWDAVSTTMLNTTIANDHGASVATIEHLMAAIAGCGLHNVLIELNGPEVPALDGSSARFARGLLDAGIRRLDAPLMLLEVKRPVSVRGAAGAAARLDPAPSLGIDFTIDFDEPAIGRQQLTLGLKNGAFLRELSAARTFCRASDIEQMQAHGRALGGTYENAVVYDGGRVLNAEGLRFPDEAVRHKMLDAFGDLATAGRPILGRYTGHRAGHQLTNRLLAALFADPANYALRKCRPDEQRALPGAGLAPDDVPAVA